MRYMYTPTTQIALTSPMDASSPALSHLSPRDRELFVKYGRGKPIASPLPCVHHAFAHNAALHPDNVAVEHLGEAITYYQLDRRADALACTLRAAGVVRGTRVCLLVQRSIAMIVGIMAVLKAGGAYVPLDGSLISGAPSWVPSHGHRC